MSQLDETQECFQKFLLEKNLEFQHMVIGTDKVSADDRLAIYSDAYRIRLIDTLASNYPVLYLYLGTENFDALAGQYIDAHPSTYKSIRWYGCELSAFLKDHHDYQDYPYLAELADFEWAMTLVFDAADSTVLQIEDMAYIPTDAWMMMKLRATPSVHRLNFLWNVVPIWQSISDDKDPEDPIVAGSATPWIIWRHNLMSRFCSLSADEAYALDAVLNQKTFGEICEGLCQWVTEEEAGMHAASLLKGWIQSGLIATITLDGEHHDE
jgi:hypothetical protein